MKSLFLTPFLIPLIALGQIGPSPLPVLNGQILFWDHDGLDVLGNPEQVSHFVVSVTGIGSTSPINPANTVNVPNGAAPKRLDLDPFMAGLAPGDYKLWVEVVDISGNRSVPSVPFSGRWSDLTPPTAATNARLTP